MSSHTLNIYMPGWSCLSILTAYQESLLHPPSTQRHPDTSCNLIFIAQNVLFYPLAFKRSLPLQQAGSLHLIPWHLAVLFASSPRGATGALFPGRDCHLEETRFGDFPLPGGKKGLFCSWHLCQLKGAGAAALK